MKIYFYLCIDGFTNSYTILNDDPNVMEAIIIDPGKFSNEIINRIEKGGYKLTSVLLTHNHAHHTHGLKTLSKIYTPTVYAAESSVYEYESVVLNGDGMTTISGLHVEYFSIPGHSPDSMVYKIEDVIFTGDTLLAGMISKTSHKYSEKLLSSKIREKLYALPDRTVIMPGHGVPSTIESEKQYNLDILL